MRVLITGGGTGGHIYPALAIARGVQNKYGQVELLYVGTKRGLEAKIVPKEGINFATVEVEGMRRRLSLQLFTAGFKVAKGLKESYGIIKAYKPDLVIGTGGYVSGPIVLVAALKNIPTLIHEQNAYPGITNKLLAKFVNKVAITFPESEQYFSDRNKTLVTGLPIRSAILTVNKEEGHKKLNLDPNKKTILIVGGSRGAKSINLAMLSVLESYKGNNNVQVLHVTGEVGYEDILESIRNKGIPMDNSGNIKVIPYLYDMAHALNSADLIICRAGATTLAEITAIGVPSILIPYPYASENHQEYNARALEKAGAAVVIKDSELTGQVLLESINKLFQGNNLGKMAEQSKKLGRPKALENILECINNILYK